MYVGYLKKNRVDVLGVLRKTYMHKQLGKTDYFPAS